VSNSPSKVVADVSKQEFGAYPNLIIKGFCKKSNILLLFIMQNPNNVVLFVL